MVFNKLALITLAAAGFASAMAVERRGEVTCTLTLAAAEPPFEGANLVGEFNFRRYFFCGDYSTLLKEATVLGREFASNFPGNTINVCPAQIRSRVPYS